MKEQRTPDVPTRIIVINEIKELLNLAGDKGIYVEKVIAELMIQRGLPRRMSMECINAVVYSGFAKIVHPVDTDEDLIIKLDQKGKEMTL